MGAMILTFPRMGPEATADAKRRLAYRLFMGQCGELEYHLGAAFSTNVDDRRCVLCGGRFPNVGMILGFWDGPDFEYVHVGCRNSAEDWTK